jgi:mono/diheme cytochrome c family protein
MFRILFGIVLGIVLAVVGLMAWLRFGKIPVAVTDPPLPAEQLLTGVPLHARIDREMVKNPPIQADEANLVAGAHIYSEQCAVCHGLYDKPSAFGQHMFPGATPLWEKHGHGSVVGVSDDPPGETYWKVANGIRLTGMPSYQQTLTETQMWQVSMLLANADKPLPPAALYVLRGNPQLPPTSTTAPAATPAPISPNAQGAPLPPL